MIRAERCLLTGGMDEATLKACPLQGSERQGVVHGCKLRVWVEGRHGKGFLDGGGDGQGYAHIHLQTL